MINGEQQIIARTEVAIPPPDRKNVEVSQDPHFWWSALLDCIHGLGSQCDTKHITRLAIDGTSATVLLCDANGRPLAPALMYNDARATREAQRFAGIAAQDSGAMGASSSLAKVLWLQNNVQTPDTVHIQHQADWLSGKLTGRFGHSDYHNVLKLGFNPQTDTFPDWIIGSGINRSWLPQVYSPGEAYGCIRPEMADRLALSCKTEIIAGTTDSIAAFLASGAHQIGDAVTSLGSTLVIKLLSDKPVTSTEHGVYSHRLGDLWLVGGASNSGGSVLKQFFTDKEMLELSEQLQPGTPTGLDYYPLPCPGERFPINDPDLQPCIEPIPNDKTVFFQGLLEGISRIEQRGYCLLEELGAPPLKRVFTAGGGCHNKAWSKIRQGMLGVPVTAAMFSEAAYGSALLAAGRAMHLSSNQ